MTQIIRYKKDFIFSFKDNLPEIPEIDDYMEDIIIRINDELSKINTSTRILDKKKGKNDWRTKKINKFFMANLSDDQRFEKKLNGEMNKLSQDNYDSIITSYSKLLSTVSEDIETHLIFTINNIFEKAVMQPIYCPYYVKFLLGLPSQYQTKIKELIKQNLNGWIDLDH